MRRRPSWSGWPSRPWHRACCRWVVAIDFGRKLGLADLPRLPVMLYTRVRDGRPRNAIAALSAALRGAVRGWTGVQRCGDAAVDGLTHLDRGYDELAAKLVVFRSFVTRALNPPPAVRHRESAGRPPA